jgi:hypothetical protein
MNKTFLILMLLVVVGASCSVENQNANDAPPTDGASSPAQGMRSASRLFGGGYPTGSVNATSIQGVPVGPLGGTGSVLTVGAGPSLEWDVPAAGVMLSSTTPAGVSTTSGAVGVGTTAARSDHTHLLPIVPLALGGFGADVSTGQTNGYYAKIVGGALTLAAILAGDIPTGIDVTKLAAGTVTNTVFGYLANVTSDIQTQLNAKQGTLTLPLSEADGGFGADISGVGTGILARSAANTPVARSLTAPAAGITIMNPGGIAGSPTFALANDLAAVEGLAGTGLAVRIATDTWANRTLTAGAGITVTNGDGVAGNPTAALSATAVSAASYPTSGQVPTFTVGADGRLTAAGSTTTLTSPAISGPVLSGSATGTYTLAGTPTMGANLAFGSSFKGTGLAAGSAAGDTVRWEQAGVAGPTFYLNTGQSFVANGYVGIAGDGSSALVANVVPWVVPVSCTLRNIRVFGFANTSGSVVFTVYKATAALSPSYAATAVTCTLTNTFSCTDTTHSVSLAAGELVVGFTGSSWAANGASITSQCIPN